MGLCSTTVSLHIFLLRWGGWQWRMYILIILLSKSFFFGTGKDKSGVLLLRTVDFSITFGTKVARASKSTAPALRVRRWKFKRGFVRVCMHSIGRVIMVVRGKIVRCARLIESKRESTFQRSMCGGGDCGSFCRVISCTLEECYVNTGVISLCAPLSKFSLRTSFWEEGVNHHSMTFVNVREVVAVSRSFTWCLHVVWMLDAEPEAWICLSPWWFSFRSDSKSMLNKILS